MAVRGVGISRQIGEVFLHLFVDLLTCLLELRLIEVAIAHFPGEVGNGREKPIGDRRPSGRGEFERILPRAATVSSGVVPGYSQRGRPVAPLVGVTCRSRASSPLVQESAPAFSHRSGTVLFRASLQRHEAVVHRGCPAYASRKKDRLQRWVLQPRPGGLPAAHAETENIYPQRCSESLLRAFVLRRCPRDNPRSIRRAAARCALDPHRNPT